ncbi:TPA_asm: hypothetical protein [Porphyromonas phage phage032a_KCOM2801]|uniref:Uncharacterized protein n=1 Tax=Porphyromonas phage phage032a_KCOM2801 TaxID=3154122 RepID=A0AAT9JFQ6_9CAUD
MQCGRDAFIEVYPSSLKELLGDILAFDVLLECSVHVCAELLIYWFHIASLLVNSGLSNKDSCIELINSTAEIPSSSATRLQLSAEARSSPRYMRQNLFLLMPVRSKNPIVGVKYSGCPLYLPLMRANSGLSMTHLRGVRRIRWIFCRMALGGLFNRFAISSRDILSRFSTKKSSSASVHGSVIISCKNSDVIIETASSSLCDKEPQDGYESCARLRCGAGCNVYCFSVLERENGSIHPIDVRAKRLFAHFVGDLVDVREARREQRPIIPHHPTHKQKLSLDMRVQQLLDLRCEALHLSGRCSEADEVLVELLYHNFRIQRLNDRLQDTELTCHGCSSFSSVHFHVFTLFFARFLKPAARTDTALSSATEVDLWQEQESNLLREWR